MTILVTASTYKYPPGNNYGFISHCEELRVIGKPASTIERAEKELGKAVSRYLVKAARDGSLPGVLRDIGYLLFSNNPPDYRYQPNVQEFQQITIPLPRTAEKVLSEVPIHDSQRVALSIPHIPLYTGAPSRRPIGTMAGKKGKRP